MQKPVKPRDWFVDEEWSTIIGVGSYHNQREDIKRPKKTAQIGFVRTKTVPRPKTKKK